MLGGDPGGEGGARGAPGDVGVDGGVGQPGRAGPRRPTGPTARPGSPRTACQDQSSRPDEKFPKRARAWFSACMALDRRRRPRWTGGRGEPAGARGGAGRRGRARRLRPAHPGRRVAVRRPPRRPRLRRRPHPGGVPAGRAGPGPLPRRRARPVLAAGHRPAHVRRRDPAAGPARGNRLGGPRPIDDEVELPAPTATIRPAPSTSPTWSTGWTPIGGRPSSSPRCSACPTTRPPGCAGCRSAPSARGWRGPGPTSAGRRGRRRRHRLSRSAAGGAAGGWRRGPRHRPPAGRRGRPATTGSRRRRRPPVVLLAVLRRGGRGRRGRRLRRGGGDGRGRREDRVSLGVSTTRGAGSSDSSAGSIHPISPTSQVCTVGKNTVSPGRFGVTSSTEKRLLHVGGERPAGEGHHRRRRRPRPRRSTRPAPPARRRRRPRAPGSTPARWGCHRSRARRGTRRSSGRPPAPR